MRKLFAILIMSVMFTGGVNAQEHWFKTLTKTETDFSVSVGSGVTTFKTQLNLKTYNIDFMFDYKGIYFGSFIRKYKSNKSATPTFYIGYGINFGNVYELVHKSDNIAHKILKRITFIPAYGNEYSDMFGLKFGFISNLDVNVVNYKNWGLNYHYHSTITDNITKYHTLNINYNF